MATVSDIYTPQTGYNPQTQALANLQDALSSITGLSPQASEALKGYIGSYGAANVATANLPAYTQQRTTQLEQASGFPQAVGQYGNLADMYKMFIADHQLAQKYTRPDIATGAPTRQPSDVPTYGTVGPPQMPVMTLGNVAQPFQGFTDPYMSTVAEALQGKGITDIANLLTQAIGYNQQQVQQRLGEDVDAYKAAQIQGNLGQANLYMNILNIIRELGSRQRAERETPQGLIDQLDAEIKAGGGSYTIKGKPILPQIIAHYQGRIDPNIVVSHWDLYSPWGKHKESLSQLEDLGYQRKIRPAEQKKLDAQETQSTAVSSMFDLLRQYAGLEPSDRFNPFSRGMNEYESEKNVIIDQLAKSFGVSRSNPAIVRLLNTLPGRFSFGAKPAGQFSGHLKSLLNTGNLVVAKNKATGDIEIIPKDQFDPAQYEEMSVDSIVNSVFKY